MLLMILLAALLLAVLLVLFLTAPRLPRRAMPEGLRGVDYAHRGLWNGARPENSLAAFRAAHDAGFGVELDVHLAADGSLPVVHDSRLQRMCGDPRRIDDLTEPEWRALRLPDGSGLPSLPEALEACGGVPLIVELKEGRAHAALCERVLPLLRAYPGAWCVESFDPRVVRWLRRHAPEVFRGQLGYADRKQHTLRYRLMAAQVMNVLGRPDFIAWRAEDDGCLAMRLQRALFRPHLVAWTVRSPGQLEAQRDRWALQIFEGFVPKR